MAQGQSEGCALVLLIGLPILVGATIAGIKGGVVGGMGGILLVLLIWLGRAEDQGSQNEEEALQEIVDDINEIGVPGAPAKNQKARNLEREAKKRREEGDEGEANEILSEAKALYRDLVGKGFEGTFPYKRLAIIHRREKDYESEIDISEKALEAAKLTEKQREYFEYR